MCAIGDFLHSDCIAFCHICVLQARKEINAGLKFRRCVFPWEKENFHLDSDKVQAMRSSGEVLTILLLSLCIFSGTSTAQSAATRNGGLCSSSTASKELRLHWRKHLIPQFRHCSSQVFHLASFPSSRHYTSNSLCCLYIQNHHLIALDSYTNTLS